MKNRILGNNQGKTDSNKTTYLFACLGSLWFRDLSIDLHLLITTSAYNSSSAISKWSKFEECMFESD